MLKNLEKFNSIISQLNLNEEEAFQKFIDQTILFDDIPFIEYKYGDNCIQPINEENYPILSKIHPLKRAAVEKILESNIPATIDKIIIFGSSVSKTCEDRSDIDICVIGDWTDKNQKDKEWFQSLMYNIGKWDFLNFTKKKEFENPSYQYTTIIDEICQTGVVIYESR